ncbi:MAG: NRDE family protein [Motiliproteus sp.]
MCLILFAVDAHPDYPLILAANRDEFYQRPTRSAEFWPDFPELLAGCDLEAQGTWLGITRQGRIAAVTNVRDGFTAKNRRHQSRGMLTRDFLTSDESPLSYLQGLQTQRTLYPGYNLLLGDRNGLYYYSNKQPAPIRLEAGVYGLSNGALNSPWPKLNRGRTLLQQLLEHSHIDPEQLLSLLKNRIQPSDDELPDTGVSLGWERLLAPCFIQSEDYGTRASTALLIGRNGNIEFHEQNYDHSTETERKSFSFFTKD